MDAPLRRALRNGLVSLEVDELRDLIDLARTVLAGKVGEAHEAAMKRSADESRAQGDRRAARGLSRIPDLWPVSFEERPTRSKCVECDRPMPPGLHGACEECVEELEQLRLTAKGGWPD